LEATLIVTTDLGRLGTITAPSRHTKLVLIGVTLMAVGAGLWVGGHLSGLSLLRYAGLMTMGTTFVPLPADTFTLAAAADNPALAVALVGGAVNAAVVLLERWWILILVDHPVFDRIRRFFDTNRYVAWTDRSMFVTLLLAGLLFFEPFRLLAVMRRYPAGKYLVATFLSRTIRYYALASVGAAVFELGYLRPLLVASFGLFTIGLWRSAVRLSRERRLAAAPATVVDAQR
jgi:membrane protein YqaA with SNARE-associated domain